MGSIDRLTHSRSSIRTNTLMNMQEEKAPDAPGGDEAIACPRCGGPATRGTYVRMYTLMLLPLCNEATGSLSTQPLTHTTATADAARCLRRPAPCASLLPANAYDQATAEAQALLARAREAAALTLTKAAATSTASAGGSSSGGDRVRRCLEELLAWLVGGRGASRRLLGDGHRLRCVFEGLGGAD